MPPRNTLTIIGVVIILAGALWYFGTRTKESTQMLGSGQSPTSPETTTPSAPTARSIPSSVKTYRSEKIGFAIQYPNHYYISNASENSDEIRVKLNKIGERPLLNQSQIDRTAHIDLVAFKNPKSQSLSELASAWGESVAGVSFNPANSCRSKKVGGEDALACSAYGGVERGAYRNVVFVKHGTKTFQFEALAPTSDDVVHSELSQILSTLVWL